MIVIAEDDTTRASDAVTTPGDNAPYRLIATST